MKKSLLIKKNQMGIGLVEALISVVLSSILILGAAYGIGRMQTSQQETNIQYIVINELQSRLQNASVEQKTKWCNKTEIPTIILPKEQQETAINVICDELKITVSNTENAASNRTISEKHPVKFEIDNALLGGEITVGESLK